MDVANMTLEDYLEALGLDYLDEFEILSIRTFIELKIAIVENKFLNPVLKVDGVDDVIDKIDWHKKINRYNFSEINGGK